MAHVTDVLFEKEDFTMYVFGMDWYATHLLQSKRWEELRESHYAAYLWVKMGMSSSKKEREALIRESFNHGLMEVAGEVLMSRKHQEVRQILKRFGWTEEYYCF